MSEKPFDFSMTVSSLSVSISLAMIASFSFDSFVEPPAPLVVADVELLFVFTLVALVVLAVGVLAVTVDDGTPPRLDPIAVFVDDVVLDRDVLLAALS